MPQYWVAGANVDDQNMVSDFIEHGFWFADAVGSQQLIERIEVGDRIAIKRMLVQGATDVAVHAIGLVERVAQYRAMQFRMIYVKWLRITPERRVPFHGFAAALRGPFTEADEIIQGICRL
jgi:hypothetical protein